MLSWPSFSSFIFIFNKNTFLPPPSVSLGDGVVAYPVMQAYGSLALEDNLEVGEVVLGRCSISCVCASAF